MNQTLKGDTLETFLKLRKNGTVFGRKMRILKQSHSAEKCERRTL